MTPLPASIFLTACGDGVRGDRKADAGAAGLRASDARGVAGDLGVDADHVALFVEQRAAGVAGLSAASVWIAPVIFEPSGAAISRPSAETMPRVSVSSRPYGLPIAYTGVADLHGARAHELQRLQAEAGRIDADRAPGPVGFLADERRGTGHFEDPPGSTVRLVAPATTWSLVRIRPLFVQHDARAAVFALGGDGLDRHDPRGVALVDLRGRQPRRGDLAAGSRRGPATTRRRAARAHSGRGSPRPPPEPSASTAARATLAPASAASRWVRADVSRPPPEFNGMRP